MYFIYLKNILMSVDRPCPNGSWNGSATIILNLDNFPNEKLTWQECISANSILLPEQYAEQRNKRKITYICFSKSGGGSHQAYPQSKN